MIDNNNELVLINRKIDEDDKLINAYQLRGISEKKISKIKLLKEKHIQMKNKIEQILLNQ